MVSPSAETKCAKYKLVLALVQTPFAMVQARFGAGVNSFRPKCKVPWGEALHAVAGVTKLCVSGSRLCDQGGGRFASDQRCIDFQPAKVPFQNSKSACTIIAPRYSRAQVSEASVLHSILQISSGNPILHSILQIRFQPTRPSIIARLVSGQQRRV